MTCKRLEILDAEYRAARLSWKKLGLCEDFDACDLTLRGTVHQWADHSRKTCPWAQTYYQAHRAKDQSHACALRCLGQRWLKILTKMWQTRFPYNEALHTRNQTKRRWPAPKCHPRCRLSLPRLLSAYRLQRTIR